MIVFTLYCDYFEDLARPIVNCNDTVCHKNVSKPMKTSKNVRDNRNENPRTLCNVVSDIVQIPICSVDDLNRQGAAYHLSTVHIRGKGATYFCVNIVGKGQPSIKALFRVTAFCGKSRKGDLHIILLARGSLQ